MKIFYGVPCATRNIDVDCAIAIFKTVHQYGGQTYFHMGISDIALARNLVVQKFLLSECDWLMMIDSDIIFSDDDWNFLWEGDEDIVTAPYARKIPGKSPALFGLGFTRVNRRVFHSIDALQKDDSSPFVDQFYMDGAIHSHYFPNGVTGDSRWLGEDRGFFTLCAMASIPYRMEPRCTLRHVGSFIFGYPDQSNGTTWWRPVEEESDSEGDNRPIVVM